ncbi:hypothetical protein [Actinosynnema pretiosum]|uniref:hypothetical protein n=1 Tax=Actinosynnema pretiosum TaxID=42197 RepID=UPI0012FDB3C1|nr:hypothetical protein [Actinosynnema pretiosum]
MSDRLSLIQMTEKLPRWNGTTLKEVNSHVGFSTTPEPDSTYVWPDVTAKEVRQQHIVLITAPGAGGKSAAAKAIAHRLNAPLIDLAHQQVGSNTLTGLLPKVLGWKAAPGFISDLLSGKRSIVLDSLDEARLLAGRNNFFAFLQDLADFLQEANPSGQVVILGRREAIEDAYLILDSSTVQASISYIHSLTHSQSAELINNTLDHKLISDKPYRVHREHPVPFADFRDRVFAELSEALGHTGGEPQKFWPQAGGFLGYPPVLLALAERLAVENPQSERGITNFSAERPAAVTRGKLLRQVIEGILDRESEKVRPRIGKSLGLSPEKTKVLYGREEQTLRILRVILDGKFEVIYPAVLDADERMIYEEQIESFVNDHPFLIGKKFSNAVFEDYVRAFIVTSETVAVADVTKEQLLSQCSPEGPFYAHFLFDLCPTEGADSLQTALIPDESLVDGIIRSHRLAASGNSPIAYYSNGKGPAFLSLADIAEDGPLDMSYSMSFMIKEPVGVLELTSPLSDCLISADAAVNISSPVGSVQFGPAVVLIARELHLEGETFIAVGGKEEKGVMIIVRDEVTHEPQLKVSSYPADSLSVNWPNHWYQWSSYIANFPEMGSYIDPHVAYQLLFWLRRVLTMMKGSTREVPSVYWELLDKLIIGTNPIAQSVRDALIEIGVVVRDKDYYRLQLDVLKEFKVNYTAIKGANFAEALSILHKRISKTDAVLSIVSRPA